MSGIDVIRTLFDAEREKQSAVAAQGSSDNPDPLDAMFEALDELEALARIAREAQKRYSATRTASQAEVDSLFAPHYKRIEELKKALGRPETVLNNFREIRRKLKARDADLAAMRKTIDGQRKALAAFYPSAEPAPAQQPPSPKESAMAGSSSTQTVVSEVAVVVPAATEPNEKLRCNHDGGFCHHECPSPRRADCFRSRTSSCLTKPHTGWPRED